MQNSPCREVESSTFGFSENLTIMSCVSKKNKSVICLSTLHHDKDMPAEDHPKHKPELVLYYSKTKGGVDNLDHLVTLCTCRWNILHWPMAVFFNMIDVSALAALAALAALIVWEIKFPEYIPNNSRRRRAFLSELGNRLISNQIEVPLAEP